MVSLEQQFPKTDSSFHEKFEILVFYLGYLADKGGTAYLKI